MTEVSFWHWEKGGRKINDSRFCGWLSYHVIALDNSNDLLHHEKKAQIPWEDTQRQLWHTLATSDILKKNFRLMWRTLPTLRTQILMKADHKTTRLEKTKGFSSYISTTITQQCQDGSREWRLSYESMVCGQKREWMPNVMGSNVLLGKLTVAATDFSSHSPISWPKSPIWRN